MEIIKHIRSFKLTKYYFLVMLSSFYLHSSSQDIKMGYMQMRWLNGYTYADTTYLLTDINTDVNRPYILVNWGVKIDTSKLIQTIVTNNGFLKKYYGTCTYPGTGLYQIQYQDTFRIANIKNMQQSSNQNIKLTSLLNILTFVSSVNTAPVLQNNNINLSVQGTNVIFQPQFNDLDGDSLSFQLSPCFGLNYYTPSNATLDAFGNLSFKKDSIGIYAFSIKVKEWRKDDDFNYVNIQSSQIDFTMDITTDVLVKELNDSYNISIYPNPTNSILRIVDEQNELVNANIEIKNTLGQVVSSIPFQSQIDISHLSSGIYFLSIRNKMVKIIKQ